jgi:hypothetical protein
MGDPRQPMQKFGAYGYLRTATHEIVRSGDGGDARGVATSLAPSRLGGPPKPWLADALPRRFQDGRLPEQWVEGVAAAAEAPAPPPPFTAPRRQQRTYDTPQAGGCLCGAVRFAVNAAREPRLVVACHCHFCQKSSGAPHLQWATIDADDYTLLQARTLSGTTAGATAGGARGAPRHAHAHCRPNHPSAARVLAPPRSARAPPRRSRAAPRCGLLTRAVARAQGAPAAYVQSGGVRRFCGACGTPLSFARNDLPDELDVALSAFDDPRLWEVEMSIWTQHKARLRAARSHVWHRGLTLPRPRARNRRRRWSWRSCRRGRRTPHACSSAGSRSCERALRCCRSACYLYTHHSKRARVRQLMCCVAAMRACGQGCG